MVFPISELDFSSLKILDVGSGPISVFEAIAPKGAHVIPYDSLADEYNRLLPNKKFSIRKEIPGGPYDVVSNLNCLDHMDDPAEMLEMLKAHLAATGELWIYVNIDRPYEPELHPQDFRFWSLTALIHRHFAIVKCGLIREGRLFPYAWWGICRERRASALGASRSPWLALLILKCALEYGWFHGVRAAVKAVKLVGLRRWLPADLRF